LKTILLGTNVIKIIEGPSENNFNAFHQQKRDAGIMNFKSE